MTDPGKLESLRDEVHIKSILVMLPFDDEKAKGIEGIDLKFDEKTQTYSFLNARKEYVHYRMIANSDRQLPKERLGEDQDGAAFLRVNKDGTPWLDGSKKPQVIVTFDGLNKFTSDAGEALADFFDRTSFDEGFYNDFIDNHLRPALDKLYHQEHLRVSMQDVEPISHSKGDTQLTRFVMEFKNTKGLVLDPWMIRNNIMGAAVRETLSHAGDHPTESQLRADTMKNLSWLTQHIRQVSRDGKTLEFNPWEQDHGCAESYVMMGAGHRTVHFMNQHAEKLRPVKPPADLLPSLYNELFKPSGGQGLWQQMFDSGGEKGMLAHQYGDTVFEGFAVDQLHNALYYKHNGLTPDDKKMIENARALLSKPGLQTEDVVSVYRMALNVGLDRKNENGGREK